MRLTWKQRLVHTGMAAIVLTMAAGGIGGASAAEEKGTEQAKSSGKAAIRVMGTVTHGLLQNPVHERQYWKLLAATYAPDTSAAWATALEERKQAEAALPGPFGKTNVLYKGAAVTESSLTTDRLPAELQVSTEPLKEGEKGTFTLRLKSLDVNGEPAQPVEGGQTEVIFKKAIPLEAGDDIIKTELPAEIKRQQQLSEAIEQGDSQAIRGLLPQLLEDYKKQTESIRTLAEKLKEQKTDDIKSVPAENE
ncbi:hypothetical protein WMW72_22355 [Paenibacillus filicis]|uniref:Uncharacterized protein n=1 Tax=Paenibacillus filicis TaxID=669464 RepID=A0ABU9DRE9_9BACL